ncbi:hypothetical protein [Streptomyces sp. NRRL S-495]|uniref:hypothetical protein n=1 Tax=Streptomyces sp. NRRL S-495 TaxID=1609133 RepID=UPI0005F8D291|nr:hypothetical protein [Streptomyces sp. NRRL S-495]KJY34864.1 hypothetical protein VR45_15840 [Streptomyces sp. NRRL S-495]
MSSMRDAAAVRGATVVLLAAGLGLALAPTASAAGPGGVPEPVPAAELAQARGAVQSPAVLDQLGRFFARKGAPQTGQLTVGADSSGTADAAAPRLTGDTVPVYLLDADFVSGSPGAPVARAEFTASKVVAADGQIASVWTVKQNGGWRVVNIATGGDESDYAARAAAGGGGTAFREPQINAWYVLRDGRVLPLDEEARRSVGEAGVSLAAYQGLVRQRYGDKLPGSAYDRAGKGGGYEPGAPQAAGTPVNGGSALPAVTAVAALGVTALAGAGLALRRRTAARAVDAS